MNNTVLIVVGVVVVVLLLRPAQPKQLAGGAANPNGSQAAAPAESFGSLVDDIATALGKVADAVKTGVQRN